MSRSIQVVIAPGVQSARVMAFDGPSRTLLTAKLSPSATHPRALPWLLEALALWEGATVRAVLAVDERGGTCASTLCRDAFADAGVPPLYTLDWVPVAAGRRRRGEFGDLRALLGPGWAR